jgi:hypothetical protein
MDQARGKADQARDQLDQIQSRSFTLANGRAMPMFQHHECATPFSDMVCRPFGGQRDSWMSHQGGK